MLDKALLAAGLTLMLIGASIAVVSDIGVKTASKAIPMITYEFKRLPPGTYTDQIVIESGSLHGTITQENPEHRSFTVIKEPPEYCDGVKRVLDFKLEGVVENKHGMLYLEILAYRLDGSTVVIANYSVSIERLEAVSPLTSTTSQGIVVVIPTNTIYTFTASGEGEVSPSFIGALRDENFIEVKLPLTRIEIPTDTVGVSVDVKSDIVKEISYSLNVLDICNYTYTLEEPHIKPYSRIEYLDLPYTYGIDLGPLRLSIALTVVGNALALMGVYLRLGKPAKSA